MTVINASAAVTLLEQGPRVALIAQLEEYWIGTVEVVGSNPAQSLNVFQVSVLVVLRPHLH